jgi:NDP-sugar pyrophosphorylase family protein
MKAGIIAAGTGERLARGGISIAKPLVPIGGEPMIARVIRAAAFLNVTSIACIVNDLDPSIAQYLRSTPWPAPLELIVKTTPSSMESLFCLAPLLGDEPFLLLTVDAVFGFYDLGRFLARAQRLDAAQGVLALTDFVDDEKPLWVRVNPQGRITGLGGSAKPSRYVTAGFYYFRPEIFHMRDAARGMALKALREFLCLLTENEYLLYGVPVPKTVDVDYPEDIEKAEAYLRGLEDECTA